MLQMASVFHDSLVRFVLPLCTMMTDRSNASTPVSSSIYLVDASELGLKQGWNLKTFAQEISWLLSTCYPETILKVFVSFELNLIRGSLGSQKGMATYKSAGLQCTFIFRDRLEIS